MNSDIIAVTLPFSEIQNIDSIKNQLNEKYLDFSKKDIERIFRIFTAFKALDLLKDINLTEYLCRAGFSIFINDSHFIEIYKIIDEQIYLICSIAIKTNKIMFYDYKNNDIYRRFNKLSTVMAYLKNFLKK